MAAYASPAATTAPPPGDAWLAELLPGLRRLDDLLAIALEAARSDRGSASPEYAGLFVTCEETERLLAREPGDSMAGPATRDAPASTPEGRLAWLERAFDLAPFDTDVLLVALAPELDLRYERIYAFLQDDVTRRRPTVDLALGLLCGSADARLRRRAHFAPEAPLIREGLLTLVADSHAADAPLLAHALRPDDQVVRLLLGDTSLDERLTQFAAVRPLAGTVVPELDARATALAAYAIRSAERGDPVRLMLHGPNAGGRHAICAAIADALGVPLIEANLELALGDDFTANAAAALREARLRGAVLALTGSDALLGTARAVERGALARLLRDAPGMWVVSGEEPWPAHAGLGATTVPCPLPGFGRRRECWAESLNRDGIALDRTDLDALAERFRLPPDRIADAVAGAERDAAWRGVPRERIAVRDVMAAARAQAGGRLAALAPRVTSEQAWDDLVLPPDRVEQLREICDRATYRHVVHDDWGFERKLALGRGLNVLFSGAPGTGKTMAASVIGNELGLEVYKVDLSQVVSKYIGETEKNLREVFAEARASSAVLFFDEADALFGSRSEVKDAHDRYANIETGYLLQKMDEYDGIVVLATNLRHNIDEAFLRRLHVVVEFPFPDEQQRRRIWEVALPDAAPVADDVDFTALARHALAGGSIRNVAVAAAFDAAANGDGELTMAGLETAARREFRKLGRSVSEPAWEAA